MKVCKVFSLSSDNNSSDLTQLWFLGKRFISKSMSYKNYQLIYRCLQKSAGKIHSTWLFKNTVNLKLTIHKSSDIVDIDDILVTDNLEEYVNNYSF